MQVAGALGAVAVTYGAYHLRKATGEKWHIPDTVLALAEDGLVAGTGLLVTSVLRESEAA